MVAICHVAELVGADTDSERARETDLPARGMLAEILIVIEGLSCGYP